MGKVEVMKFLKYITSVQNNLCGGIISTIWKLFHQKHIEKIWF